jgi:hypothetical protein
LRAVSPDARSFWVARAASGSARRSSNVSSAARRYVRASTRRWERRRKLAVREVGPGPVVRVAPGVMS